MYSILIVDDEAVILEGLKEVIEEAGLPFKTVETAGSADEALRLYERTPFDILLTDISMPEKNGLCMAEEMKKVWPFVEVIFLTGFQDFEYVRSALRLQSFDYLLKPVPDETLVERLKAVIEELDRRWLKEFMYDSEVISPGALKNQEAAEVLRRQMEQGRMDFEELKGSGFPFDRERRLRLLVVEHLSEPERMSPEFLHNWLTGILQKLTYGYGYICGFLKDAGHSVFLIQKSADSEALFTGVYKALEELQGYFYMKLDLNMTVVVSHRCTWEGWIGLIKKMLEKTTESGQDGGAFYTYEEKAQDYEESGNLLIYKIRDYIGLNPGNDLSLGNLARQFHINPSYLSRCFHQTIGKPLSVYITQVRIQEAKRLLWETDCKVYEIAAAVGFDTQGYFTKVFNKVVGMSPKEYRMNKKV